MQCLSRSNTKNHILILRYLQEEKTKLSTCDSFCLSLEYKKINDFLKWRGYNEARLIILHPLGRITNNVIL